MMMRRTLLLAAAFGALRDLHAKPPRLRVLVATAFDGDVIAKAEVRVVDAAGEVVASARTDDSGLAILPQPPKQPGLRLRVSSPGFKFFEQTLDPKSTPRSITVRLDLGFLGTLGNPFRQ